jgi:hypothetical protein
MSRPPQPIACLKCNTINYSGVVCKQCKAELTVVSSSPKEDAALSEIQPLDPETEEQVADSLQDSVADLIEGKQEVPSVVKPEIGKSKPLSGVDKELARRKLKAKIRDARSGRMPLNEETEVRDRRGKRVVGARRVPTTVQAPLSTPENPYERL